MNSISSPSIPGPWLRWTSRKSSGWGRVLRLLGREYRKASRGLAIMASTHMP